MWLSVTPAHARALEPALHCVAALHSPSTGIIDSHLLMLAFLGDAERAGALLALKSRLAKGVVRPGGVELHVVGNDPILASQVVNSAGLRAPSVARRMEGYPIELAPPELYAKGSYYTLAQRSPFSRLVYPVPEPGGLGVHVTLDLGGHARFGPDVEWVDAIDYTVDPRRAERFYAAIRRYWPGLPDGALEPGYAGIRPKISGKDAPAADFVDAGPEHARRAGPGESVRHRIARTDRVVAARGCGARGTAVTADLDPRRSLKRGTGLEPSM